MTTDSPHYLSPKTASLTDNLTMPKGPPIKRLLTLPAYYWVLLACLAGLLVHTAFLPIWLSVLGTIVIFVQKLSIRNLPIGKKTLFLFYDIGQFFLFFGGILGLWLQFGQLFGLEFSVSFLLLCMICKICELKERRDAYVMLNMSLFVLVSAFLWTQGALMTIGVAMGAMIALFGFVALNENADSTATPRLQSLKSVALPALPLLVVLFLFFPRISPLWHMPMASGQATTGVSDSMSPGDFSNLSKSTELAFRVEFDGKVPPRHELYWRAMVFSDFDGITWRPHALRPAVWRSFDKTPEWATPLTDAKGMAYRVLLEPNHQHWLTSLEHSRLTHSRGLAVTDEFTFRSFSPVAQNFSYKANYLPAVKFEDALTTHHYEMNLALPQTGNEKSKEFAKTLMNTAQGDPQKFVSLFQNHIHNNNFRYTLSPPLLQNDRIDEFLFGTQAGFCEHYASSFVFLARAAGIPARVVVGYQGGEFGRDGKSWEVRQMDAHAWAEIWTETDGWQRIDPTAFVAPSRIEDGMDSLTNSVGSEMFGDGVVGAIGYQQFRLLQNLRRYSDQASYYWQKNIVGFDQANQADTLLQLFNISSLKQQLFYLIGSFVGIVACIVGYFWHRRRVVYHPLDLPFIKLSKKLGKRTPSLAMASNEPILTYLARLSRTADSDTKQLLDNLSRTYRQHRFGKANKRNARAILDKNSRALYKILCQK